jgi:hypothetical protein
VDICERSEEPQTELARDTAAYFDSLPPEALAEEVHLGAAIATAAVEANFTR